MKNTLTIWSLFLTALIVLALTSFKNQDTTTPTYATVFVSGKIITIHNGSQVNKAEITINKGENVQDKIIDVLNNLSEKGFELVSSNSLREQGYTEFYYTLRKVK